MDKAREVVRVPNGVNVTVESRLEAIINALSENKSTSEAAFSGDIEKLFEQVGGKYATDPAKKWWDEFKRLNYFKKPMIRQFLQELIQRKATINEFYLANVYSGTDSIQANLYYLDYIRIKKEEERKKKKTRTS